MAERDPGLRRAVDFRRLRQWRGLARRLGRQAARVRRFPSPGTLLSLKLDFLTFGYWNFGIPSALFRTCFGPSPMPPPFHSLENPFEPPKKRLQDDAELIGKFLGREAEEEMRKIMALNTPLMKQEAATLKAFFGESITVPPLPREITPERIKNWDAMGFELHYLPPIDMTLDADFPGWEKKPHRWFYEEIAAGRIAKDATMLPGAWVLVDGRQKPSYNDGNQMYADDPLAPVLEDLNRRGLISQSDYYGTKKLDPRSRFGLSPEDVEKPEVMNAFAKALDLKPGHASLTEAIVWNVLANIHHPEWGTTYTSEWQKETDSGGRLISGRSVLGGASYVSLSDGPYEDVGF